MRIAIVNDVDTSTHVLRHLVERESEWQVAWTAKDGSEAVQKCRHDVPDMILMDLLMPVMDGVEATRQIMSQSPCAILVVTAGVEKNAPLVYEALGAGALDAVDMPGTDNDSILALLGKIKSLVRLVTQVGQSSTGSLASKNSKAPIAGTQTLVAIGSSTGGPAAVSELLRQLPSDFPAAIVLIQHIDVEYAEGMAQWLNQQSDLEVRIAGEGDRPEPGCVLVAATNDHLVLDKNGRLKYNHEPAQNVYRPSVDEFYASAALHWTGKIIGVLLTGMGRDGARGLLALRRLGHDTLAQNEKTCAVYGMPQAAVKLGAAMRQLPPSRIAEQLLELTGWHSNTGKGKRAKKN